MQQDDMRVDLKHLTMADVLPIESKNKNAPAMIFASKKIPPEIIAVETCMTSQADLSAGTSGALGTYKTVTAVPSVSNTEIETNKPNQRRSYLRSAPKYAVVNASAPVIENSYILPHGTRPADTPRAITPANKRMNPKIIMAVATRATFSVRV